MISLPRAAALPLLALVGNPDSGAQAWLETARLLETGEATLEADLIAKASRHRVSTKTLEEVRYPREFAPPQPPIELPPARTAEAMKVWPYFGATPTAYEAQEIGESMELVVEPSPDGKQIRVEYDLRHKRLQRWQTFAYAEAAGVKRLSIVRPIFHEMTSVSTATFRDGEVMLVGAHALPPPEQGFELFLLRVDQRGRQ